VGLGHVKPVVPIAVTVLLRDAHVL
jgi:hypothetical protein